MSDVVSLAESFRSDLVRGDAHAIEQMTKRYGHVEARLSSAIDALAKEIEALQAKGEDVPRWKLFQLQKYQALLAQIASEMSAFGQFAITQLEDEVKKKQALAQKHAQQMLGAVASSGKRSIKTSFDQLPKEALESITAIAQAGQPLNKLFEKSYPTAVGSLTTHLLTAVATGANPRTAVRQAIKQGLGQGFNHLLLVFRDQQIRHYREMTRGIYNKSGVVYGYMRLAAKNKRTCLACLTLDGSIYSTEQLMPLHPQDRCTMIPLVQGFPLPSFQTGRDWFAKLPKDDQIQMMGRGKWEAWRDGLFSFDQLVSVTNNPTWGPSARITSLKDLLKGRGGVGGQPIDPAVLLKKHQEAITHKPRKPRTLALSGQDKDLVEALHNGLGEATHLDTGAKAGVDNALTKILAGDEGLAFLDVNGRLTGAISYTNQDKIQVTGLGFADAPTNLKGVIALAELAQQNKQSLELYVPQSLISKYQSWGFTIKQSVRDGARMVLAGADVGGFLKDPDSYGQAKIAQLTAEAKAALADPNASYTFRVGQELPELPFKKVNLTDADVSKMTKQIDEPPFVADPKLNSSAGMLLFTPDGKLVLVDPSSAFGGYKTTFPKGRVEDGNGLQETAVREVWEESGFKARILGHLGDYQKTTSLTRYYIGVVEDGAPWAAHYETEAVRVVPLDQAHTFLNVGQDKAIISDLRKVYKEAMGDDAFSVKALEEGLDKVAVKKAEPPKLPQPSEDPASMSKKALVEHLANMRGIAKWKLGVMKKDVIVKLFDLPEAEAIAQIEQAGAAHTAKHKKPKGLTPKLAYELWTTNPIKATNEQLKLAYAYAKSQGVGVNALSAIRDMLMKKQGEAIIQQFAKGEDITQKQAQTAVSYIQSNGKAWIKWSALYHKALEAIAQPPPQVDTGFLAWQKYNREGLIEMTVQEAGDLKKYIRANSIKVKLAEMQELTQYAEQNAIRLPKGSLREQIAYLEQVSGLDAEDIALLTDEQIAGLEGKPFDAVELTLTSAMTNITPQLAFVDNAQNLTLRQMGQGVLYHQQNGTKQEAQRLKQEIKRQVQTAVPTPPPLAIVPDKMTKTALAEALATAYNIPVWKLKVMPKKDLVAVATKPQAEVEQAADQAAQAHKNKYAKKKKPPPPKPDVGAVAYQKMQQTGVQSLTADEAQNALDYAKQQGFSSVIQKQLQVQYQEAIGDPILLPNVSVKIFTKKVLVEMIHKETGHPIYKLNQFKKAELVQAVGRPMSYLGISGKKKVQAQTAVPTPLAKPKPQPTGAFALDKLDNHLLTAWQDKVDVAFVPGSPAGNGAKKVMDAVQQGQQAMGYTDATGAVTGLISFDLAYASSVVKITGAAFKGKRVNLEAVADVGNEALKLGKSLLTYVPKSLISDYQQWGFTIDNSYDNGSYMTISPASLPKLVTLAGKTPAQPPPKPKPQPTPKTNIIGYPSGKTLKQAKLLKKPALMIHVANAIGVKPMSLSKFTKAQLLDLMTLSPTQVLQKVQSPTKQTTSATSKPTKVKPKKKRPLPPDLPAFKWPDAPDFPQEPEQLKVVKRLGGSTGAELVEDGDGRRFVRKRGNSANHLREEAYADAAYRVAGLNVPRFKVYDTPSGPVKLAEFIEGKSLSSALNTASPSQRKKIVRQLREGFGMDALMGNWDVVGQNLDNVLVDKEGKVWRIDNGGSLRFRAQGQKKEQADLTDYPVELWTLRDSKLNPQTAQIFGKMDIYEVMASAKEVVKQSNAILGALPEEVREMVNGRLAILRDLIETSDTFQADQFNAEYTDAFLEQSALIRREGLIDRLPEKMSQNRKGSTTLYDENGKAFDDLRGKGSHVQALASYMKANGADPNIIRYWMGRQAADSWKDAPQALKYHIATQRGGNYDNYWWRFGLESSKKYYEATVKKLGKEKYERTWAIWHAFVYESLKQIEMPRKTNGFVELVRTEDADVMKLNNINKGDTGSVIKRGAAESASIYRTVKVFGSELTTQRVPLHRILGYYLTDRPEATNNDGAFLGDGENEFVFIPEGIPFNYVGSVHSNHATDKYWS